MCAAACERGAGVGTRDARGGRGGHTGGRGIFVRALAATGCRGAGAD